MEQINIIVNNYPYEEPLEASRSNGNHDRIKSKETFLDYPPRLSTNGCNGRLLPELPITRLHNSHSHKLSCQFTNSQSSSHTHIASTVEEVSPDISQATEHQNLISKSASRASWSTSIEQAGGGKEEEDGEEEEEEEKEEELKPYTNTEGGGSIAMAVGIFVATVVGTPVFFAAGIKLGMFAGIAGGAMGYTTGKMFADHE